MNIPVGRDLSSMQGRVIDSFDSRSYYSGADVRFEFNDIPVDDMTYIAWKVVEPVKNHYGYASRYRLRVSRGVRMVSGQMGMNFKDPLQLHRILQAIRDNYLTESGNTRVVQTATIAGNYNVLAGELQGRKLTAEQKARSLGGRPGMETKENVRAKLELYRDAMWGKLTPHTTGKEGIHDALYKQRTAAKGANADPVLDPYLFAHEQATGGDVQAGRGTLAKFATIPGGFNVRMIFGEPDGIGYTAKTDQAGRQVGAIHLLNGVEIMSSSMEVTETGEPIRLLYEFSAADVF